MNTRDFVQMQKDIEELKARCKVLEARLDAYFIEKAQDPPPEPYAPAAKPHYPNA